MRNKEEAENTINSQREKREGEIKERLRKRLGQLVADTTLTPRGNTTPATRELDKQSEATETDTNRTAM